MTDEQLIEQFQLIENTFSQALTTNNTDEVSKYITKDWVLLEPQFGIITKEQFLYVIKQGDLSHTAMNKKVQRVRLYKEIAIVIARGMNVGFFKGEAFNTEIWVTNVYKKEIENWICIMTTESPVTCK